MDFWKEDLAPASNDEEFDKFILDIDSYSELQEASLSEESAEVSSTIAGYVARKIVWSVQLCWMQAGTDAEQEYQG